MSKEKNNGGGIGLSSLLGVVFIVLKLTDVIDWSWWWVLLPFWGGALVVLFLGVSLLIIKVSAKKPKNNSRFQKRLDEIANKNQ